MKRFPKGMIGHGKHGVLSLNERITNGTLLKMFSAIVFPLDWNPFKLWPKLQFNFTLLLQFSAMEMPINLFTRTLHASILQLFEIEEKLWQSHLPENFVKCCRTPF